MITTETSYQPHRRIQTLAAELRGQCRTVRRCVLLVDDPGRARLAGGRNCTGRRLGRCAGLVAAGGYLGLVPDGRVSQRERHLASLPATRCDMFPALGFWVLMFVLAAWMLWGLREYVPQFAVWIRQMLNAGPSPRNIMNDLNWAARSHRGRRDSRTLGAHRHHGRGIGRAPRASGAFTPGVEAPAVLAVAVPAAGFGRLRAVQAGLVDS